MGLSSITAVTQLSSTVLAPGDLTSLAFRVALLGQIALFRSNGALRTMLALANAAFEKQVLTYGVGTELRRTRLAAARGLAAIVPKAPVLHNGLALGFDDNGRIPGLIRVFTFDYDRNASDFARLLSDGNVAIFNFAVRGQLRRPTVLDYLTVQSEGLPPKPSDENRLGAAAAAGIFIGAAIILGMVVGVGISWRHRSSKMRKAHGFGPELRALPLGNRPFEAPLELPLRCLRLGEELGRGSFGQVLNGTLSGYGSGGGQGNSHGNSHGNSASGSNRHSVDRGPCGSKHGSDDGPGKVGAGGGLQPVAIKVARLESSSEQRVRFLREMLVLAQFRSDPHVVRLEGVVTAGPVLIMVMELCAGGSLASHLLSQQRNGKPVDWNTKYAMARDVAAGMASVHAAGYLHMDLSARNVLVTASGRCKVCDFGLATEALYYETSMSRPMAVRWMAPEVLRGGHSTRASDVWSFGVLLFELGTNASVVPYAGLSAAAVVAAVQGGRRLEPVQDMPLVVREFMSKCHATDREDRPDFAVLCTAFGALARCGPGSATAAYNLVQTQMQKLASAAAEGNRMNMNVRGEANDKNRHGSETACVVPVAEEEAREAAAAEMNSAYHGGGESDGEISLPSHDFHSLGTYAPLSTMAALNPRLSLPADAVSSSFV